MSLGDDNCCPFFYLFFFYFCTIFYTLKYSKYIYIYYKNTLKKFEKMLIMCVKILNKYLKNVEQVFEKMFEKYLKKC